MERWGRLSLLLGVGIFVGAGCGGRTGANFDDLDPDGSGADGSGAGASSGGASSSGGRPSRAGSSSTGGTVTVGGAVSVAGGYPGGGPSSGGYGYGGYGYGGAYPVGGYGYGGYGYAGAYPVGGYGYGGYPGYPIGGYGYGGNPMQPGGACCEASMQASCRPRAVAQCVCRAAPYCCDKAWDDTCARLVEPLGCGDCGHLECETCLGRSCGPQVARCYQDAGCVSIYSCMRETGCRDLSCYTEGWCRGIIDAWGGPGSSSMGLLLETVSCSLQSGCPCY